MASSRSGGAGVAARTPTPRGNSGDGGGGGGLWRTGLLLAGVAGTALAATAAYLVFDARRRTKLALHSREALRVAVGSGDLASAARALSHMGTTAAAPLRATELGLAAKLGDDAMLALLLTNHIAVESRDERGATALLASSALGKVGAVEKLLAAGADALATDGSGLTAAHYAASGGHVGVLRLLARAAAAAVTPSSPPGAAAAATLAVLDVTRESDACRPLFLAASSNQQEALAWLVGCGVDVCTPMANGVTPLMVAAQRNRAVMVQTLVAAGADVAAVASAGRTALNLAAVNGALEAAAALMEAGAKAAGEGSGDELPLACAARKGHVDVLRLLAAHGADVDCMLDDGRPLLVAACQGNIPRGAGGGADGESEGFRRSAGGGPRGKRL